MISKEEVIKLAKLARLDFSDDELDKIRNISTSATPAEEFRKDEVKPSLPNEKILSNVNASKGFFCVKGGI